MPRPANIQEQTSSKQHARTKGKEYLIFFTGDHSLVFLFSRIFFSPAPAFAGAGLESRVLGLSPRALIAIEVAPPIGADDRLALISVVIVRRCQRVECGAPRVKPIPALVHNHLHSPVAVQLF